jgi:hypothetical protein
LREKTKLLEQLWTKECGPIWKTLPQNPVISFSGGVADCIETQHPDLAFGDIGPILGRTIRGSRLCQGDYRLGTETIRATVIGAGCHSTQLSGSTVFFQNVNFPLKNLPVVTDISALSQCIKLEKLDVSCNKIGWFSGKFNVPTLTHLNLSGNPLSNIDALDPLTKLTYLNANGCQVTNIKVVGFMPDMTELYLSGNPIYHGHSELAKLTKLQKLDLSKALLQDRHLEYLPMDSLTELDLRENPNLTEDAVKALVAEHPNCTIFHDYQ